MPVSVKAKRIGERTPILHAATEVAGAVHAALGAEDASVRVALPDDGGRLRVIAAAGPSRTPIHRMGRRRRRVFETGRGVAVASSGGRTVAVLPLAVRDETVGVLELVAPARRVDERRDTIVALVRQSGALFKPSDDRVAQRGVLAMERLLALAGRLNAATGAVEASRAFVEVASAHLDVPVAIVRPSPEAADWSLAAVGGLEARRAADLGTKLRAVPFARRRSAEVLSQLSSTLSLVTGGATDWRTVGESVALVDAAAAGDHFFLTAASMLEATLERVARNNGHVREVDDASSWRALDEVLLRTHAAPPVRNRRVERAIKRTFDVVVGTVLLLLTLPLALVVMMCIALDSRGPVFFVHHRVGRDGISFPLLKFRTMVRDAEHALARYIAEEEQLAEWKTSRKLRADPRVTRVGRFLRRFSIDELPQLLNVLVGDMSLVGPRPVTREEVLNHFAERADRILSVRPGLTGLWAVSGRSDLTYEERVEREFQYAVSWSVWMDAKIMVRTVPIVLRGHAAY